MKKAFDKSQKQEKLKGCMIEGMGCPGRLYGRSRNQYTVYKSAAELKKYQQASSKQLPPAELAEIQLD